MFQMQRVHVLCSGSDVQNDFLAFTSTTDVLWKFVTNTISGQREENHNSYWHHSCSSAFSSSTICSCSLAKYFHGVKGH